MYAKINRNEQQEIETIKLQKHLLVLECSKFSPFEIYTNWERFCSLRANLINRENKWDKKIILKYGNPQYHHAIAIYEDSKIRLIH